MKTVLKSTLAALSLLCLPAIAQAEGALDAIAKSGVVKIAVPQDFPPFGSVGPDMKLRGCDIDMAELIAKALGVKVEMVPVSSVNRIPYLTTGKVDMVISSLGKNPDREKVIDFTQAYLPFYLSVFGPADAAITTPAQLSGKVVGATRGSIEDLELTKMAPGDVVMKRYEDNNSTIAAYLSGQVELMTTGNVVVNAVMEKNPPRKMFAKFVVKNSPVYVGIAKGDDALKAKINDIIAAAKADGSLNAVSQKWLGAPLPGDL